MLCAPFQAPSESSVIQEREGAVPRRVPAAGEPHGGPGAAARPKALCWAGRLGQAGCHPSHSHSSKVFSNAACSVGHNRQHCTGATSPAMRAPLNIALNLLSLGSGSKQPPAARSPSHTYTLPCLQDQS